MTPSLPCRRLSPWIEHTLAQEHEFQRLAWFLYGCYTREHALNLQAWLAWWVQGADLYQVAGRGVDAPASFAAWSHRDRAG